MDDQPRLTEILRAIGHQSRPPLRCRRFGAEDEFAIQVAGPIESRLRAWRMVYRSYLAKEFAAPHPDALWYGIHDAVPATTTFLVTHRERDVATMTVAFDSPAGLPADGLYHAELETMRRAGRRPCEYLSLANDRVSSREGTHALEQMFRLAHLTATHIEDATDVIITVNPRHTAFYERIMLFRRIGEQRSYDKVGGAPAVLMRFQLDTAEERLRERYGTADGSLYRFFFGREHTDQLIPFLHGGREPLDDEDVSEYFVHRRPLIPTSSIRVHRYFQECYPRLDSSLPLRLATA